MVLQSSFNASPISCDFSRRQRSLFLSASPASIFSSCPCANVTPFRELCRRRKVKDVVKNVGWVLFQTQACINGGSPGQNFNVASHGVAKNIVLKRFLDEEGLVCTSSPGSVDSGVVNYYRTDFGDDPIIHKLRNQLGVIHPLPAPPMSRNALGLFAFLFFVGGVVFDKLWTPTRTSSGNDRPYAPTSLPFFLEKDLQRKESVEWVNMVLAKLWKVYRSGIENWIIGLLQPVIDNIQKPDYVQRVQIKQFSLGDEPLSVRSVERRTSRRVNDLQYQISLRYTGDARMLLLLSLKFSVFPIVVPVGIRDFDIDGELWVKLRLIAMEPWVGAVSWAFVSLPKIKFELSPFRLFNLMAIPVLSMFLKKLLTEDLPKLFVRPKKIVLDFQKGKAVRPIPDDPKSGVMQEGNGNYTGELSVTLLDARKLSYLFYGKTDPYVILTVGKQVIRSKRNSQTTVIGPPGEPIWNQDFHLLVADPRKEKLHVEVRDCVGFMDLTVGVGEVDLASLKDTVPTERVVSLRGGWDLFGNGSAGEIVLCLTYKAYVEDEEDERLEKVSIDTEMSEDELSDSEESYATSTPTPTKQYGAAVSREESLVEVLAALLMSEEFRGIMTSDTAENNKSSDKTTKKISPQPYAPESQAGKQTTSSSFANPQGLALFWLAVATSMSIIAALNIDHSNLFNP